MVSRDALEADAVHAFAVFSEHLNFTAAAAALHLSQPSLHVKIRKLGQAMGTPLYERHGRQLRLTPTGTRLAAFAQDSRRRVDDFLAGLGPGSAPIAVAAGRGSFRWVIGSAIAAVVASGRQVTVQIADGDAAIAAVTMGQADCAVVAYDPPPRSLSSALIASYPMVLMVPAGHPLASHHEVSLAELDGLRLVVPPASRAHRRVLERALADAGSRWEVAAGANGWDLLVHFASLGIGATVVNGCVPAPPGLAAVPIRDLPAVGYWATWRPERSAPAQELISRLGKPSTLR